MAHNESIRTTLFGGYNRDDVDEYIKNLECEMESVKLLHQKEKLSLMRRIEEREGELKQAQSELEAARAKLQTAQTAQETEAEAADALRLLEEELDKELGNAEQEAAEQPETAAQAEAGDQAEAGGQAEARQRSESVEQSEKEAETLAALEKLQAEYESLEKENRELKAKMEERDDLFDYDTVLKIMEEARTNAELIEKEAKEESERMLQEARDRVLAEEESLRQQIARRVNVQLEEKGIQLMAAKYKIEQYIKEIDSTQQGLYLLNNRMEKMVKDMPVRLDDYWEGEEFFQLEEKREKEIGGESQGKETSEESKATESSDFAREQQ